MYRFKLDNVSMSFSSWFEILSVKSTKAQIDKALNIGALLFKFKPDVILHILIDFVFSNRLEYNRANKVQENVQKWRL